MEINSQQNSRKKRMFLALGGFAGIIAIVLAVIQIALPISESRNSDLDFATQVALQREQNKVLIEMATLQANDVQSGPTATYVAEQLPKLEGTVDALEKRLEEIEDKIGGDAQESEDADSLASTVLTPAFIGETDLQATIAAAVEETVAANPVEILANTPLPTDTPAPTQTPLPTDTPVPTTTSTPTLTPIPPPDFYDSFDIGIRPEWEFSNEDWAVIGGQLVSLQRDVRISLGDEGWSNYTVEFDIFDVGSNLLSICWLEIMSTQGKYISLGLENRQVRWHRDGKELPSTKIIGAPSGLPYSVKVTAKDGQIMTFIDGNSLSFNPLTLPDYTHGKINLYCTGTGSVLDNFKVSPSP